jgi:ATP-binding cassette subfamily B protein
MPDEIRGEVVFDHVNFSYVPGTEIIHDLDLHVEPGQRIAIVGPTGSGKTTISNLLLRYYDPDSGTITIDGIDLRDIRREDVRKLFSVVLQDTWLFKGTIRQNLVFGDEDVPDEKLEEVCRAVGLGHYIGSLPDGLDTYLSNPENLSSGQKQQITIARAVIKGAPLLIMDEATSSVDTRTERAIQQAMDELMKGRTSFVIAHRLSTIISADRIIVIRKGEIVESGTHEELIGKGGFYRSLYDSQFEYCD